jgi:unspecific peroxygenase
MGNDIAKFITYASHLADGNLVTNLLSIGGKTDKTGPDPPSPAIVGGLNTHAVFEGDASMTRGMSRNELQLCV